MPHLCSSFFYPELWESLMHVTERGLYLRLSQLYPAPFKEYLCRSLPVLHIKVSGPLTLLYYLLPPLPPSPSFQIKWEDGDFGAIGMQVKEVKIWKDAFCPLISSIAVPQSNFNQLGEIKYMMDPKR